MLARFRFRWIPFIAAMTVAATGISLGQWQMRRADEKKAIEAKLSAREYAPPVALNAAIAANDDLEYRRIVVKGEFIRDWPVYLDNRPLNGAAGFYVVMPFKIAGSDMHLPVMRGWARRDAVDRARLPALTTPDGIIELQGIVVKHPGRLLQLGRAAPLRPQAIVQNLDLAEFAQASRLTMQPFLLEQQTDTHDGLVHDWPRPSAGIDKHLGYAFQWYALAATAFIFFIVTGYRRAAR
jgi:surfeit locus 1 family protein